MTAIIAIVQALTALIQALVDALSFAVRAGIDAIAFTIQAGIDAVTLALQATRPFIMVIGTCSRCPIVQALFDAIPASVKVVLSRLTRVCGQHRGGNDAAEQGKYRHGFQFHAANSFVFLVKNMAGYCV
jgi:hypothetical protein